MKRTDPDMLPTEGIFAIAYHLVRHGWITVEKAAVLAGCSENAARRTLNKASRIAPIDCVEPGLWQVVEEERPPAASLAALLDRLRAELAHTQPGTAFCRPLARRDMVTLVRVLESQTPERA